MLKSGLQRVSGVIFLYTLLFLPWAFADQIDKPLLSEEIRAAIEAGGPTAAKPRMLELYPAQKDKYQVDMQGFTALGMSYMQAGDHEAANAVMELLPLLLSDAMAASPYGAQMQQMAVQERQREQQRAAPAANGTASAVPPGPAIVPTGSNRGVVVDNAVVRGADTRLMFHTFPQRGDPGSGKDCPLNFYAVTLRPGLPQAAPDTLASGVCGFTGTGGRLLDDGDLLLVSRNELQRWRAGEQLSATNLSSLSALGEQDYDAARAVHLHAIASTGEVVLVIPGSAYLPQQFEGASFLLLAVSAQGKQRWHLPIYAQDGGGAVQGIWHGPDGMVLAHVMGIDDAQGGGVVGSRHLLHVIAADGRHMGVEEIARDVQPNMEQLIRAGEQGLESAMAIAGGVVMESVERIAAQPAAGGGFHVLFERHSDAGERYGHFLYRIGADGAVSQERPMNRMIRPYRLQQWVDFNIDGAQLTLLASVMADQHGVNSRRKQYRQNVVGRIDLNSGFQEARLVPLDRRYLEAVMNAGDAQLQYLDDRPGGDPVLLSRLGDKPLAVTVGYRSRRQVPRVDEVDGNLALFASAR